MDIIIKEARIEDAKKLIEYTGIVGSQTEYLSFGKEGIGVSLEEEEAFIRGIVENPKSVMYLAWKEGEIVGCSDIRSLPNKMSHRADFGITVVKSEWRKGIGSMLLEKCISFAKECGLEIINLEVMSENTRAVSLYKKFGFVKTGKTPACIKANGRYIDADTMYLDLRNI